MNPWLAERAQALEPAAGFAPGTLSLTSAEIDNLLEVARFASEKSRYGEALGRGSDGARPRTRRTSCP